jgi:hypothetical protein
VKHSTPFLVLFINNFVVSRVQAYIIPIQLQTPLNLFTAFPEEGRSGSETINIELEVLNLIIMRFLPLNSMVYMPFPYHTII